MTARLAGLTIMFLGLALVFTALSFAALGRGSAAAGAVVVGLIVGLLGRRLLLAAGVGSASPDAG